MSFQRSSTSSCDDFGRQKSRFARVAPKNIGESRRDDDPEAEIHERPDGVLARRPGAEIRAGHQNRPLSNGARFRMNDGSLRQAANKPSSKPVRVTRFR